MRARPPVRASQRRLLPGHRGSPAGVPIALVALASSAALAVYAGCITPPAVPTVATVIQPGTTSVSVDPFVFLGAVECSNLPGAMQSYVATVTDRTNSGDIFPLSSSPPTPCSQSAYFEDIIVGDIYTAVVDGYEYPADDLVPTCGAPPPGVPATCAVDSDCPPAYGCQGRCLVSVYLNEDVSCLQNCLVFPDGGTAAETSAELDAFATCVANANDCASSSLDGYVSCVGGCATAASGAVGAAEFLSCLNQVNECLVSDIPQLQAECPTAPPRQMGGIPDGGEPDSGVDGGGDLVLAGEVQACTCVYPIAEGDRTMYLKMKPGQTTSVIAQPRWQTPQSPLCGESLTTNLTLCYSSAECTAGSLCEGPGAYCDLQAQPYMNVSLTPCTIVDTTPDAGVMSIEVVAGALLYGATGAQPGAPACTTTGGASEVTSFDVVPVDPALTSTGATMGVACSSATVTFTGGLVADTPYAFTVIGHDGSSSPAYAACCFATARAGVEVAAMCDPLTPVDGGVIQCGCPDGGADGGAGPCP